MRQNKWLLFAIFAVAVILRVVALNHQSYTMDECLEQETAEMTIDQIVSAANSFPPLYHLLLKAWLAIESSPVAVRTFSLVTAFVSIGLTWLLAKEAANDRVALLTASITATSAFHIYYSQQGRGYMLLILLATAAMYLGLRIMRHPSTANRMMFVIVSVAGGYTHYYFALVLVAIGIGVLAVRGPRYFGIQIVPLAVIIGLLCSPLAALLSDDLGYQRDLRDSRPPSVAAIGYTIFSYVTGYTLGPSRAELHSQEASTAIRNAIPWLGLTLFASGLPLFLGFFGLREWQYWASLLGMPFLLVVILCYAMGVTYNTRFLVYCWVPFCILLAAGLDQCLPRPRVAMLITLIGVSLYALYNRHQTDCYQNEDVRSAAAFIHSQPERPIITCAGYMFRPLQRYLKDGYSVTRLMDHGYPDGSDARAMETIKSQSESYWLVYARAYHGDPNGILLQAATQGKAAEPVFTAPGVKVFDIQLP